MRNGKCPIIYHPYYDIPLPNKHRFPGTKYSLLIKELERSGLIERYLKYIPKPATSESLSIAHAPSYIEAVRAGNLTKQQQAILGLPWSECSNNVHSWHQMARCWLHNLLSRQVSLVMLQAELTMRTGIFEQVFCVFNDLAFAALALLNLSLFKKS